MRKKARRKRKRKRKEEEGNEKNEKGSDHRKLFRFMDQTFM